LVETVALMGEVGPGQTHLNPRESPDVVAQTSESAVSRVSKPAGHSPTPRAGLFPRRAGLETGDTAGLETCATPIACWFRPKTEVFDASASEVGQNELCERPRPLYDAEKPPDVNQPLSSITFGKFVA
jgi:hypothetical protein